MTLNRYQISSILSLLFAIITNGCLVSSLKNQREQVFGRYKPVLFHLTLQDIFLAIWDLVLQIWFLDESGFMSYFSTDVRCFILHSLHSFYVDLPLYQVPAFAYTEYVLHRNPRYRALPFFSYATHIIVAWLLPLLHNAYSGYKFVIYPKRHEMQYCQAGHIQNTSETLFVGTPQWTTGGYYVHVQSGKMVLLGFLTCLIYLQVLRAFGGHYRKRFYREDRCTGGLLRRDAENKIFSLGFVITSAIVYSTRIALLIVGFSLVNGDALLTSFIPSAMGIVLQFSTSINAIFLLLLIPHIR